MISQNNKKRRSSITIARLNIGEAVFRKEKERFEFPESMAIAICFTVVFGSSAKLEDTQKY